MNRGLAMLAGILGVLLLILAVIYFITPASSLPSFLPGYDPTLAKAHLKHGVGALLLAGAVFAFVWFQSGKKSPKQS
jgi:cytochrome c biogenesis protein CcdA